MEIKKKLQRFVSDSLLELGLKSPKEIHLEHPADPEYGDYASNVALTLFPLTSPNSPSPPQSPQELAQALATRLGLKAGQDNDIDKVEAVAGFINFYLSDSFFVRQMQQVLEKGDNFGASCLLQGQKIMVEFAHPNTHKEMHIGHMRTLITGEALSRIFEASGALVFRANYQGDIGPHVAKAIWGTEDILLERGWSWEQAENLSLAEKAHLLGEGYVRGNQLYKENKKKIDGLNARLYQRHPAVLPIYERTRQWSLDYYNEIYQRFGTKFNKLYFESEVSESGKKIVLENLGPVFEKSEGAVIFNGEKYGLHKRVFITQDGHPTYEAKDIGLAPLQFNDFPFDLNVHVVASEQKGYFEVVFKALELVDERFGRHQMHLPMGMVQLAGQKMSSRKGVIITVDGLLDEVKKLMNPLISTEGLSKKELDLIAEAATLAAVKYSVLKVNPQQDVIFEPARSVSLQGNSGPYLQYAYARARSILRKADTKPPAITELLQRLLGSRGKQAEYLDAKREMSLLGLLYQFPEIVEEAAKVYAPNLICSYLFELAREFNSFYEKERVIGSEKETFRLALTAAVAQIIKNGLFLLGMDAPERM